MKPVIKDKGKVIEWTHSGTHVRKEYPEPIIDFQVSENGRLILILEPARDFAPENAAVYDAYGRLAWRLPFTAESGRGVLFDRAGLRDGHLMAIAIINGRDVGFVIDENLFSYSEIFEAR